MYPTEKGVAGSLPGLGSRVDLDELRTQVLRWVLVGMPATSALLGLTYSAAYDRVPYVVGIAVPALVIVWLVGEYLLPRRLSLAAGWTVASLFLMLVGAMLLWPKPSLGPLFTLVVLVATLTLEPAAGFAVAGFATLALASGLGDPGASAPGADITSIALVWTCGLLSWVTTQHLRTVLEWYATSYSGEQAKAEELRHHRGELSRTLKSLGEAYEHLERLNEELARARLVAEEARRLKAEFATNLSHELRTPLNLIIGFSELMVTAPQTYGDDPVPQAWQRDVDAIHRNAEHLSSLIDDILDLGQLEAGHVGLYKERLCLVGAIAEAVAVVDKLYQARGLELAVDVPPDLPTAYADRTRVRQVLINLLTNAARFTQHGGVRVSASAGDHEVIVAVADTGPGIPREDIPKVFEEFRQLGPPQGGTQAGRGLGLAICKRFVELHGGAIWAESEIGRGTTFYFSLPVHESVVALAEPAPWRRWPRLRQPFLDQTRTLVLVATDPEVQGLIARHLGGYRVVSAGTWEQAHDLAQGEPVHAFVVVAPTPQDCLVAAERLPERACRAPVAVCSLPSRQALAQRLGAVAYLTKPVSRTQVHDVLARLHSRARRALVVDDDPEMARLLAGFIGSFGSDYRVWKASGGAEALALLRERRFDVVLLDLVMPDVDGYAVLQQMRGDERLRRTPVVVVTAVAGQDAALDAGLVAITRWPGLPVEELTRCLRASLDSLLETAPSTVAEPAGTPAG